MNRQPKLSRLALSGLVLALIGINLAAFAGFGTRMALWHFGTGFAVLKWGAILAVVALLLSLVAFYITRFRRTRRGTLLAVLGIGIAIVTVVPPLVWLKRATEMPRIHDISTDTSNPPQFQAVMPLRHYAANSTEYGGHWIARQQHEAYPDIKPAMFAEAPRQVFKAALAVARELGWQIIAAKPDEGRIEATDTTFWFGFTDDIVIRIKPEQQGTRLDVRSESRVGLSDVGTNAKRIRTFLKLLQVRIK
jgi:uncharacterized protein (DUF1499 family)